MIDADFLLIHAGQLLTLRGKPDPRRAGALRDLGEIPDGALAARKSTVVWVGTTDAAYEVRLVSSGVEVDAGGRAVMPGFVDPHTHLLFAGSRAEEWEMRLDGATYQEIAARGGGILSTVQATRAASLDDLVIIGRRRLRQMLHHGTTTVEAKSGYCLDADGELRLLRAIRKLQDEEPIDLVPTYLGAHWVPPGQGADEYVEFVCEEVMPRVAAEGLAAFCDVFCEQGAFDREQSLRVLQAGRRHGMGAKIHADEFSDLGGAEVAVQVGAASADHLLRVGERGVQALAASDTMAVLLPATAVFLSQPYAPARALIDAGAAVALGTDFNPGTSPTLAMPAVCALACSGMRMHPAEVLTAATHNAACAVGLGHRLGSLDVGKQADLLILDAPDYRDMLMALGTQFVACTVKGGRVVAGEPPR